MKNSKDRDPANLSENLFHCVAILIASSSYYLNFSRPN